jgi:hypothetical protein
LPYQPARTTTPPPCPSTEHTGISTQTTVTTTPDISIRIDWEHMFVLVETGSSRTCGRCGHQKPASGFAWRRKTRGERDNYYRPCRADYKHERYMANRERYIANAHRRSRLSRWNARLALWGSSASGRASTVGRPIRWCWSSTTLETRASTSPRAYALIAGKPCSTRSPSAR